jgi:hypothetical protein
MLDGSYIDQLKCALMYLRLKLSEAGWGIVWGIAFLAESVRRVSQGGHAVERKLRSQSVYTIGMVRTHDHCHSWSTYQLKNSNRQQKEYKRQETLVVRALIKLENRVDVPRSGEIVEDYLVWTDAYNGAVFCKQRVDSSTLLEAENVCREPEVGYRRIPRTGDIAERRKAELI